MIVAFYPQFWKEYLAKTTVLSWKLSVATASSLVVLLKRFDYKSSIVHSENSKTFEFAKSRTNFLTEESVDAYRGQLSLLTNWTNYRAILANVTANYPTCQINA